jgi:hypothetical protein
MSTETNAIRTFDAWVRYVFDHPVTEPAWHWSEDADTWQHGSPAEEIAFLTCLFEECDGVLRSYSDAQVAQGVYYVTGRGNLDYLYELRNTDIPFADRLRCIEAMEVLFERLFAARCSPHLSHLRLVGQPDPEGLSPLNGICYMWWDTLPLIGMVYHDPEHPDSEQLDGAVLAVLKRLLKLDAVACQESALFGLADCALYDPKADEIIDEFIETHPHLWKRFKPELRKTIFRGR